MDKIWLRSYPKGIAPEVPSIASHTSLVDLLLEADHTYSDRVAFTNFGSNLTYHQVATYSHMFATFLQKTLQLRKGDRIAIMLPNCLQFPIVMFGALQAGLIIVNVNPLYTARELVHQLSDAKVETVVVLSHFAKTLEEALSELKIKSVIVTDIGDLMGVGKRQLVHSILKYVRHEIPRINIPNAITFRKALRQGKTQEFKKLTITSDDIAFLQYTGGTTGLAKGAELTHGNILVNVSQCLSWIGQTLYPEKELVITALPLYHIFSLTVCCFVFYKLGCQSLLVTNPRELDRFIKILKKNPFTIFVGVNTLFSGLLNRKGFEDIDFSTLKLSIAGGMAMQSDTADKWQKMTKRPVIQGYGLTEASPVVTINPIDMTYFNGSIGLPIPSTEVMILDKHFQEVEIGEIGELAVKGPQVMRGYWGRPEATKKAFTDSGFFLTGDLGYMDKAGFIYLVDRKKDMIVVSGFNVYPSEVEDVIMGHSGVAEVGVIGLPSTASGEVVTAFIIKKDADLTEENVIEFCRSKLAAYKVPKLIEFREELPKSSVGKILRRELRDMV